MTTQPTVTTIANDAIDQLQVAREYMRWFDSLTYAISSSFEKGHNHHAEQLAAVAKYLAGDYHNFLDCEVESLNSQLDKLELRN
ncbi:hypothetical protein BLL42_12445 [Pseudomonas frederiksbergensis]|uniref:Uncharacterized protein n=1 Tax=Pseudomonas frederiksbergensis TaxID=104087 RepID=A0A1J0EK47_9PSED|nr:hypothetical protein [Pseudomonas frederiksbergensis]APC16501.1 hypothetical protein BLL42_12445 [Pseudomonas frederiksbergensis]